MDLLYMPQSVVVYRSFSQNKTAAKENVCLTALCWKPLQSIFISSASVGEGGQAMTLARAEGQINILPVRSQPEEPGFVIPWKAFCSGSTVQMNRREEEQHRLAG